MLVDGRPERHLRCSRLTVEGSSSCASMPNLCAQLALPLRRQLRRAQHRQPLRVPGREQFGGDQSGLDRLADADAVGDQQPRGVLGGAIISGTSW